MDRARRRSRLLIHLGGFALALGVARADTPAPDLRALRWIAPGADAVRILTRRPVECLAGQPDLWLVEVGRDSKGPRMPHLTINNVLGILRACQRGLGIAMLPDYLVEENGGLMQLFAEADPIALDAFFVYPEELKTVARVQAFRDFLVSKAQRWSY